MLQQISSVKCSQLPGCKRSEVTKIHIYDFDQTLYTSPVPNPVLYPPPTVNHLKFPTSLANGGWYQNREILEYSLLCRKGKESGKWNMQVAELASMSVADENTLAVVLTGRSESLFRGVIGVAAAQFVEDFGLSRGFDAVCLKNDQQATIAYKHSVILSLLDAYQNVSEIAMYDDRRTHCARFETLLEDYAKSTRPGLRYSVINVPTIYYYLPSEIEIELVFNMVAESNQLVRLANERPQSKSRWDHKQIQRNASGSGPNEICNYSLFSLHNSVKHSSFALDREATERLQEKALHYFKQLRDYDTETVIKSLDWYPYPFVPINPIDPVVKVSVSSITHLLAADSNLTGVENLSLQIQKGHMSHQVSWCPQQLLYFPAAKVVAFRLTPVDEVSQRFYEEHPDPILILAGPKNITYYSSKKMFEMKEQTHTIIPLNETPLEPFHTQLGVYHNFRLKSVR